MRRENIDTVLLTRRGLCALAAGVGLGALVGCGSASGKDGDVARPAVEDASAAAQVPVAPDDEAANEPVKRSTFAFNTLVSLTVYGLSQEQVEACLATCSAYEELFSARLEGSDVWRLNHAGGEPVEVDPRTAELLQKALECAELSGGAFDVTVGAVSLLWDFENAVKPDDAAIEEALGHVGYEALTVDGTTAVLADPQAAIDLGGIAKGWIAGRLRDDLVAAGATAGIVNLGTSSTCLFGTKPDGSLWRLGLRDPRGGLGSIMGVVELTDCSITSSGLYDQQFELDGVAYWHILDPQTGYPAQTDMLGDTVVCEDPTLGDALSTTLFTMGIERATQWIEEEFPQVPAMFLGEDDQPVFANDFVERCRFTPMTSEG